MEFIIISVKDKVTKEFMQPVFVHNHDEAKRLFAFQIEKTELWKENIEQFELYDLGLFDSESGNIIGNDETFDTDLATVLHPELICKGSDLLTGEE